MARIMYIYCKECDDKYPFQDHNLTITAYFNPTDRVVTMRAISSCPICHTSEISDTDLEKVTWGSETQ